jgi:glucose-1-phosphate thymidylyltransferase
VQTIEKRQGIKIGCPEEAAFRNGFLTIAQLEAQASKIPNCEYRDYLNAMMAEARRLKKI